ncbi:MAG: aldo/keto reductase [Phycisphaera sp.]|nr:aldo/keto reductase [Phycisphaera sp.]
MKYRTFPGTDLSISEVGLGVWTISTEWWGVTDTALRHKLLRDAVFEYGINHINTAPTYGDGYGETIIKDVLGDARDKILIVTKYGYDISDTAGRPGHREREQDYTPDGIRAQCEASLDRLGTDVIDLYEAHNPRIGQIDNDDVIAVLEDLKAEGKIRYWGVTLGPKIEPSRQCDEGVAAARRGYHSVQMIFNALEQECYAGIAGACHEHNVGMMCRVPHSSGLLEGNLTLDTKFERWDHRSHRPAAWLPEGLKKVETLDFLTAGGTRTIGQAALKYTLHDPLMMSTLPNVYDEANLREFATTSETPDLTEEEFNKVQELYAANFGVEAGATM